MAQNDVIDLDPFVLNLLQQSSSQATANAGIPTPRPTIDQFSPTAVAPDYLVQERLNIPVKDTGLTVEELLKLAPTPKSELAAQAGILNEGLPLEVRFDLSKGSLFNEDLQKKNIEFNLKRYFKEQGLINDDYDFGLRVGPESQRLEFRDPRFENKYNVIDPFGLKDIVGDLADLSFDTILPLATEVTAGVATLATPGIGQIPGSPILAASLAAGATSIGRLKYAQATGRLSSDITDEDIVAQALQEAGWSAAFGLGGSAVFELFKPVLRGLGLANPKYDFNINEDTFLRAYGKYVNSPEGKAAEKAGITPSSAQVLEAAGQDKSLSPFDRGASQAGATELAEIERRIATSPSDETAEGLLSPARERAMKAEKAITDTAAQSPMPENVAQIASSVGEEARAELGKNIKQQAINKSIKQQADLEVAIDNDLTQVQTVIDEAISLPSSVASDAAIGKAAQDAVSEAYDISSGRIGKAYEDLFNRWSQATGLSIDSVIVGKGAIRPTEAVDYARKNMTNIESRPFANPADAALLKKVLNTFSEGTGSALKIKPMSLRTLNENIRDLRRLERKAYLALKTNTEAPSPEIITNMVDMLEKSRSRVLSRKDVPSGLAEELTLLDNQFADFSKKFRNVQKSAVAKLRNANTSEAAFNYLFQKDARGQTAVLDIFEELNTANNKDLLNDVSNAIRKRYLDTVVKKDPKGTITKIDLAGHNKFMRDYRTAIDLYLSPSEKAAMGKADDFARITAGIQAKKQIKLNEINEKFQLGGGKNITPETIFKETWKDDSFTKMSEVYSLLRESPEVLDTFKAFVFKDMFDPAANRVKNVNGREVIDPDQLQIYVDKNKDKISKLLGQDYLNNLNTIIDATKVALTDVPRRGRGTESGILTGLIRGYVGMFTRPGRILTAFNKIRGQVKQDALTSALADPEQMAILAKASKQRVLTKELEKTLGRIFMGRYDFPTDEELNVPQPSRAALILEELENR